MMLMLLRSVALMPALLLSPFLYAQDEPERECIPVTGGVQGAVSNPAYAKPYGAFVEAVAISAPDNCDQYRTPIDDGDALSGRASASYNASSDDIQNLIVNQEIVRIPIRARFSASSNSSSLNISATASAYNLSAGANGRAYAVATDLLWVEDENAAPDDVREIPVSFCSNLTSNANGQTGSNASRLTYVSYALNGEIANDTLVLDGVSSITHTSTGEICRTGHINMVGRYALFSVGITTFTIGNFGVETISLPNGADYNIQTRQGSINASFSVSARSFRCYSASGNVAGCDRPAQNIADGVDPSKPSDMCMASDSVGNPINFTLGYKYQNESDYAAGSLSLNRHYRSDRTWGAQQIGAHWRHNFQRDLSITQTPQSRVARITDAQGAITAFRADNTGAWQAFDPDITTSFETLPDEAGYRYTTRGDTAEYYNQDLQLIRIAPRAGQAIDLAYDDQGRLSSVTDESARMLIYNYSGDAPRIDSILTPDGLYDYSYDALGNLTSISTPDGEQITYLYENANFPHALTGMIDERGVRFATFAYDDQGRATSTEHANGVDRHEITYNDDGSITTTNPLEKETTYFYDTIHGVRKVVRVEGHESANCAAANKDYRYDARGFLESKTDWKGNVTRYVRDDRGLATQVIRAAGSNAEQVTTTTYDPVYRLATTITENGKVTDYDYDSFGRMTSQSITDTQRGDTRTTTYHYYPNTIDDNGNLVLGKLQSTDGTRTDIDDITTYEYDNNARLVRTINALGHVSETLSFDASDRPTSVRDANGIITNLLYDEQGRLERSIQAVGTELRALTRTIYDEKGRIKKTIAPNGTSLRYAYNQADRLIRIINSDSQIIYSLDAAGNRTQERYRDANGDIRYRHRTQYDELSRTLRDIADNGDRSRYFYDVNNNLTRMIDGNQNNTRYRYDALDRRVKTIDALDGQTIISYNDLNHTTKITDPRANATRTITNAFGETLKQISPDTGTTIFRYDEAGNMIYRKDARGIITRYSYDALNRLTHVRYPSDPSLNVVLTYDMASGCGISQGQLCRVKDQSGITRYVYDELNRLISVTEIRGDLRLITRYEYDLSGYLTRMTLPSGKAITYTRNGNNQITAVTLTDNGAPQILADNINYLPFGSIETLTFGNGIDLINAFNTSYQLTQRSIGSLFFAQYDYDQAGHITNTGEQFYDYDALYRLTDETGTDGILNYSYDAIGNRLTENNNGTLINYLYPQENAKLESINGEALLYDPAGNLTQDRTRSYTINAAGQVQAITINGAQVASYVYDANNLRTQKITSDATTHYSYGYGNLLSGEYNEDGTAIREYVYLSNIPLVQINTDSSITYLHTDHLGTPRSASDDTASEVWQWRSDAFGNGLPSGSATINLRFAGQYYDTESGLHYNHNRYYNPQTGRYITSDPIELAGGINTYAYVAANPVMFVDPEGLVINIFIGGFGDHTSNIVKSYYEWFKKSFSNSKYFSHLDYTNIQNLIAVCDEKVNIIGHSYGGDTAGDIVSKNTKINLLITVDPVSLRRPNFSSIVSNSKYWINIRATPNQENVSDKIARFGGRWGDRPKKFANSHYNAPFNHENFWLMMRFSSKSGKSAEKILKQNNQKGP